MQISNFPLNQDIILEQINQLEEDAECASLRLNDRDHALFHSGEMARESEDGRVADVAELAGTGRDFDGAVRA